MLILHVVAYWMKAVTQTLPVATYLHSINPIKHSPLYTQCDQGGSQKESLTHFLSTCPKCFEYTQGREAASPAAGPGRPLVPGSTRNPPCQQAAAAAGSYDVRCGNMSLHKAMPASVPLCQAQWLVGSLHRGACYWEAAPPFARGHPLQLRSPTYYLLSIPQALLGPDSRDSGQETRMPTPTPY